jgi:hypothetical protein
MLRRDAGRGEAGAHRGGGRRVRVPGAGRRVEDRTHAVEPAQFVLGGERGAVGDVVGVAREPVEGVDMRPQVAADQPRADREVLIATPLAGWRLDAARRLPRAGRQRRHRR